MAGCRLLRWISCGLRCGCIVFSVLRGVNPCGSRPRDKGSVTAETAVALPTLVLVLGAALWGIAVVAAQMECVDAARTGARAAARGEPLDGVREAAARAGPRGASVSVERHSRISRVTVSATIQLGWSFTVPPLSVSASAVSTTEPGASAPVITDAETGASMADLNE
ncbi:TadE family type IV pilus minor pilin [Sphaerisporangium krabiense]|nr:TadE family type IV pilus minor pilin [Sphaerisporangium krabiense]